MDRDNPLASGVQAMIRKVFLGAVAWTILITLLHVQLNVTWSKLAREFQTWLGEERAELVVGFLPVT